MVLGWTKFRQNPTAPIQQILTSRRSVSFFIAVFQAIFCGLGFTILFSLYSIFHKLSFWSMYLVQCPMFFIVLYIKAQVLVGNLTSSLLASCVLVTEGITRVFWGRRNMRIRCRLSCISFSKAHSLYSILAQCIMFIYSCIRFFIIILISFIKEGIKGIVLGYTSCLFHILNCKPK